MAHRENEGYRVTPKSDGGKGKTGATPGQFADTTPQLGMDSGSFTLQTIMTMQATLGGLVKQIEGMEKKLDGVADDGKKHGHWIYAANVLAILGLGVIGFMAKMIWDVVQLRMNAALPPGH
jgi:hypothetical protein